MEKLGSWAFIAGIVLAIVFGFLNSASWVAPVLVILGLVIGFLNITDKEVNSFLVAAVALILSGNAGQLLETTIPLVGGYLAVMLNNLVVLMAPAAIVVAVKAVWELASN